MMDTFILWLVTNIEDRNVIVPFLMGLVLVIFNKRVSESTYNFYSLFGAEKFICGIQ